MSRVDQARLGGEVRRARLNNGLTQAELAERLDVTVQTVKRWEAGTRGVGGSYLAQLEQLLGVRVLVLEPRESHAVAAIRGEG